MKMKKILFSLLAVFMLIVAVACGKKEAPTEDANAQQQGATTEATQNYHIGIVTTSVSQSEDNFRGAEAVGKRYGLISDGGKVTIVTVPDNFMQEQETTISQMVSLADDPDMKAIIVAEGIPGTYPAFKAIREKRPDILLFVNNTHEDPVQVSTVADVVVNSDSVARGYLIVKTAHDLGATKFMHISFPRHLSYETISRRRAIMEQTAKDLGMEYIEMSAPDPVSDVGVPGAQQFILEQVPNWIKKYGKDIAFFATNDAQTEPLLKQIAAHGGIFIEADLPSPTMGYPGALGIEFTDDEKGNWPKILEKVEKSVVEAGGSGRMGTWAYSYNFAGLEGLTDLAVKSIESGDRDFTLDKVLASLDTATPGSKWNGSLMKNNNGVDIPNSFFVYQDTYIFGKGYMGVTSVEVPEKYGKIGNK
nr:DUF3798 domain-containing protein [uncultured Fusobacterium sp.]